MLATCVETIVLKWGAAIRKTQKTCHCFSHQGWVVRKLTLEAGKMMILYVVA